MIDLDVQITRQSDPKSEYLSSPAVFLGILETHIVKCLSQRQGKLKLFPIQATIPTESIWKPVAPDL